MFGTVGSMCGAPICSSDARPAMGTEHSGFSLLTRASSLGLGTRTEARFLPVPSLEPEFSKLAEVNGRSWQASP